VYYLDFDTMSQVMREHQQTGRLYADVPSGIARIRGPCRIEIIIKAGAVIACAITNSASDRLIGKEAIYNLSRLGRLRWTLTSELNTQVAVASAIVPQRAVFLEQSQMSSWPRLHKLVFALADGATSTVKIAEMLATSPDLVDQALRDLQRIGVISVKQQSGNEHQS